VYTAFASVYDRLMQDVPYEDWASFYRDILQGMGIADGSAVAECACGTGNLTIPLSRHYRITGIDISQDMLSLAAGKARNAGQNIRFVRQDMRALSLHKPVDAVLCTCDGFNYLAAPGDAQRFLQAAFEALRPGGVLALDISTLHKLRTTLGTGVRTLVDDDIAYIWHSRWCPEEYLCRMELTIFARRADGTYDRIEESQVQRAYPQADVTRLLHEAGFTDMIWHGDCTHTPRPDEARLHVAARKPST
jgi:ubiquinone/menaquinone biosynthesis C-methylase UbiE